MTGDSQQPTTRIVILGGGKAFGQLLKLHVHGFVAWFVRRTYYLFQMPGWRCRLRIMIDWTFALLFRPDVVKISLDSETDLLVREAASDASPGIITGSGMKPPHALRDGTSAGHSV